jgi:hypothetical protein
MKRLRVLLEALGPAGIVAIGILLFAVAFYASAIRPAERELSAQRLAAERGSAPAAGGSQVEELQRFYRLFPALHQLPDETAHLYALARDAGVELPRADYRLEKSGAALIAYHVTLPVHAPYLRIRQFVGSVLKSMPTVAIDALRFERKKSDDPDVNAYLHLTVYFRNADEDGTQ